MGPTMNLISETHHSCERREYAFMVLRKYTVISPSEEREEEKEFEPKSINMRVCVCLCVCILMLFGIEENILLTCLMLKILMKRIFLLKLALFK